MPASVFTAASTGTNRRFIKRALRFAGQALLVVAITLALDYALTATLFSGLKRSWLEADAANLDAYIATPYNHDLRPGETSTRVWGRIRYAWRTDQYGFRIGECAPGEAEKSRPAIFVIGDSFVEALGATYERSFAGLMACDAARQGKAVWNLGVASYSPVIYWRKIEAAARKLGLRPREIYVFLDLSDIDDEANVYRVDPDGTVQYANSSRNGPAGFDLGRFLLDNFTTARFVYDLYVASSFSRDLSLGRPRARWTFDPELMAKWGKRGLELAGKRLDRIVALCHDWQCRLTLIVYPWPDNVAARDRDSVQVRHWRAWARQRGVRFVDGFAPFFREPADTALGKYFIPGDVHFTQAGNRLLYETVRKAVGGEW